MKSLCDLNIRISNVICFSYTTMKRTNTISDDTFPVAVNARLLSIIGKINLCSQNGEDLPPCPPAAGWGEGEEGQTDWSVGQGSWEPGWQPGWMGRVLTAPALSPSPQIRWAEQVSGGHQHQPRAQWSPEKFMVMSKSRGPVNKSSHGQDRRGPWAQASPPARTMRTDVVHGHRSLGEDQGWGSELAHSSRFKGDPQVLPGQAILLCGSLPLPQLSLKAK